ncbi:TBC1 domain family member 1-like [Megalops cyprinoides]|uniref:TBC1 domain family member 1-like n=1 Tax=Megalops cyprinoides TaxID=118141 RepID=UPI001863EE1D|nr:TBC1 domain family member 1-like [Megalops cyprinoides]
MMDMEGICFEVKRRNDPDQDSNGSTSPTNTPQRKVPTLVQDGPEAGEEEFQYALHLVGSLPVHRMTTMAMLPWIVAEIRRLGHQARPGRCGAPPSPRNEPVLLQVSATRVRCVPDADPGRPWHPLQHTVQALFEHQPHRVHKLIHNSQEPSYFGCLIRDETQNACYVFRCQDHFKVRM